MRTARHTHRTRKGSKRKVSLSGCFSNSQPKDMKQMFLLAASVLAATALQFTGNVEKDFVGPAVIVVSDGPSPDVGTPPGWPYPTPSNPTSGWDMKDLRFFYNAAADEMNIGVNCFGICGDADGNGDPSVSSPELLQRGGTDLANLGQSESIAIALDLNLDGAFDFVVGVPSDQPETSDPYPATCQNLDSSCFGLYRYLATGSASAPIGQRMLYQANDAVLPWTTRADNIATSAQRPDMEWTIVSMNGLLTKFGATTIDAKKTWSMNIAYFSGSFQDDGIGEDYYPNSGPFSAITFPCSAFDACDVCGGNGTTCLDCSGAPNGPARYDVCDVCAGNGKSCADCKGIAFGKNTYALRCAFVWLV
jgi:hypothetical protein